MGFSIHFGIIWGLLVFAVSFFFLLFQLKRVEFMWICVNLKHQTNHINSGSINKTEDKNPKYMHSTRKSVHCLHHNALIELNVLIEVKRISFINFAVNVSWNTNIEVKRRKWKESDTMLHLVTVIFIVCSCVCGFVYSCFVFLSFCCCSSAFIYVILELLIKRASLNWAWQLSMTQHFWQ